MSGSSVEVQDLTNRLVDRAAAFGMEVSTEKSKIMTSTAENISVDISMNDQKLDEVTRFQHLGATLCKNGSCLAELRIGIALAMAAMPDRTGSGGATLSASQASSICTSLLLPPSSSVAVKHGPCLLTQKKKKGSRIRNKVREETSSHLLLGAQDQ